MEVYLEIGLPEVIKLTVVEWSHILELDYKQIPFKCRFFHGYGHFSKVARKKEKKILKKRRLINGVKFRNQVYPIRSIERTENKQRLLMYL